jgi:LmbE family N-acetylglucosaminyl deacetylase
MQGLGFPKPGQHLSVLCLGAHSDDIEIGAGGTLLGWIAAGVHVDVHWCVLSAAGPRAVEARSSAAAFLDGAVSADVRLAEFRDGFFPAEGAELKLWMEELKPRVRPDVIFTHRQDDAHQDHREISRLTWNTFRDHLILEYEIPKWDGDIGRPNVYFPLTARVLEKKLDILSKHFASQRPKDWFDVEVFRGIARLRGMECRARERYAEAFTARKVCLG